MTNYYNPRAAPGSNNSGRDKPLEERILVFAGDLAARFHPEKIILFGSHARGCAGPESDVDILAILPHDGHPARKAAEILQSIPRDFPLDLIVRSPEKWRERLGMGDPFYQQILGEGVLLYQAASSTLTNRHPINETP